MSETIFIAGIQVRVRRSGRRRQVGLTVERDGTLAAAVPVELSTVELDRIVSGKVLWIHKALAQRDTLAAPATVKRYVAGEGFYYLGRKFRLRLVHGAKRLLGNESLRLYRGYFEIDSSAAHRGREMFVRWYSARAREWIDTRLATMRKRIGVSEVKCRVRDLGNRWGSCSDNGTWEHNHGAPFWNLVRRGDLDFEAKRRWLHRNGPQFNL